MPLQVHRERLEDLSDAELVDLFSTAISQLQCLSIPQFNSMVLNQGDRRNHAHLHLKVRMPEWAFKAAMAGGPTRLRQQVCARLGSLAAPAGLYTHRIQAVNFRGWGGRAGGDACWHAGQPACATSHGCLQLLSLCGG